MVDVVVETVLELKAVDTRPPVKREFFFKNMNFFNKPFFDGSNPVVTL